MKEEHVLASLCVDDTQTVCDSPSSMTSHKTILVNSSRTNPNPFHWVLSADNQEKVKCSQKYQRHLHTAI